MYEIYEVYEDLDGTETFIDEASTLEEANRIYDELVVSHCSTSLWIVEASDDGYGKVVRT